jgi:hypothetical protein
VGAEQKEVVLSEQMVSVPDGVHEGPGFTVRVRVHEPVQVLASVTVAV